MAKLDLLNQPTEVLAETADLDEIMETVRGIEKWEEPQAEVLDHIYRYRVLRLIRASESEEDLGSLLKHLDRVTHPRLVAAMDGLSKRYGSRFLAYLDMIALRLAALRSGVAESLTSRAHVAEVLQLVKREDGIRQSKVKKELGLRPANLTRILDLMEANELIERKTVGREKLLFLGANGKRLVLKESRDRSEKRGAAYLRIAG